MQLLMDYSRLWLETGTNWCDVAGVKGGQIIITVDTMTVYIRLYLAVSIQGIH